MKNMKYFNQLKKSEKSPKLKLHELEFFKLNLPTYIEYDFTLYCRSKRPCVLSNNYYLSYTAY